jgi:hypothetical protein
MTILTDVMMKHIQYLVYEEHRPFSYLDFIRFETDDQEFKMAHGTFRNIISRFMKEGKIEVAYRSHITFYTLKGVKFGRARRLATVTGDPTGVLSISSSHPLYRIIRDLPLGRSSIHDIHLRFTSPGIYNIAASAIASETMGYRYFVLPKSKDISLPGWKIQSLETRITIHRTDTASVVIGCSSNPVVLDVDGIIQLTNTLSVVEDRLSQIVGGFCRVKNLIRIDNSTNILNDRQIHACLIPPHSRWTVTMWHFGADASIEYSGEKFCFTWKTAENVLRVYSKLTNNRKTRIRLERQEYPKVTLADVIEQKLSP